MSSSAGQRQQLRSNLELVDSEGASEGARERERTSNAGKRTKHLGVELPSDRADPSLSRLSLHKLGVKRLLELDHVDSGGWGRRDRLHPELTRLLPLPRREDRVQNLLRLLLFFCFGR